MRALAAFHCAVGAASVAILFCGCSDNGSSAVLASGPAAGRPNPADLPFNAASTANPQARDHAVPELVDRRDATAAWLVADHL